MKLGKSGITRILRECAAFCGLNYQGTFNDMRYTLATLLFNLNFSGDQIRARLGQSSKTSYENYIRKAQQDVDWKQTQAALESLSNHRSEDAKLPQGRFTIRPSDCKRVYVGMNNPVPTHMPLLNDELKNESTNSLPPQSQKDSAFSHRPRHLQPNTLRELSLNSQDLFDDTPRLSNYHNHNHSRPPTTAQVQEFRQWTDKRRVRKDAPKSYDENVEFYESNTDLLFHKYSSNSLHYNKQSKSRPFIFDEELDDPFIQTQIMSDINKNFRKASEFPDVEPTQKLPSADEENDSTAAVFDLEDGILTQTQMLNNDQ